MSPGMVCSGDMDSDPCRLTWLDDPPNQACTGDMEGDPCRLGWLTQATRQAWGVAHGDEGRRRPSRSGSRMILGTTRRYASSRTPRPRPTACRLKISHWGQGLLAAAR